MNRQWGTGCLLVLQFFSVIPVRKQLPMEKSHITAMYSMLPVLGLLFGSVLAASVWLLRETTDVSSLLIGFAVVAIGIALSGGLHLDGLADTADAYFSYQDREKRLDIMGDPRIGAFGTIVLVLAIVGKITVVAESIDTVSLFLVAGIPILSRIGLLALFSSISPAKPSGLAAFFQQRSDQPTLRLTAMVFMGILLAGVVWATSIWLACVLLVLLLASLVLYRAWCLKNFGGVTGDLFGAYVEGVEILLWLSLLFFI